MFLVVPRLFLVVDAPDLGTAVTSTIAIVESTTFLICADTFYCLMLLQIGILVYRYWGFHQTGLLVGNYDGPFQITKEVIHELEGHCKISFIFGSKILL